MFGTECWWVSRALLHQVSYDCLWFLMAINSIGSLLCCYSIFSCRQMPIYRHDDTSNVTTKCEPYSTFKPLLDSNCKMLDFHIYTSSSVIHIGVCTGVVGLWVILFYSNTSNASFILSIFFSVDICWYKFCMTISQLHCMKTCKRTWCPYQCQKLARVSNAIN